MVNRTSKPLSGTGYFSPPQIEEALAYLRRGGVILFPTDTVYGLGCRSDDRDAMRKIFALKRRAPERPLQLLLSDRGQVERWAARVSDIAQELMERFWPGGLTVLLPAAEGLPIELTGGAGRVGLRVPDLPDLQALIALAGGALAATSANFSGQNSPWSVEEIPAEIRAGVDYTLDAGRLEAVPASTVVDCSQGQPRQLRRGAIGQEALERCGVKI